MNVCTKYNSNPLSISLKTANGGYRGNVGITNVRIHQLRIIKVCTRFYANPSHRCEATVCHCISENFDLLVALEEKSGDH